MLTNMPYANKYFLSPLKPVENRNTDRLMEVGGAGVMDEVGKLIDDKQVALVMGISQDRCILFVDVTDVECVDIINKSKESYDQKAKKLVEVKKEEVTQ